MAVFIFSQSWLFSVGNFQSSKKFPLSVTTGPYTNLIRDNQSIFLHKHTAFMRAILSSAVPPNCFSMRLQTGT
jgi:hypothetical protein